MLEARLKSKGTSQAMRPFLYTIYQHILQSHVTSVHWLQDCALGSVSIAYTTIDVRSVVIYRA
jgi:hypothetical protein